MTPKSSTPNKCKLMFFVYILGQGGAERVILNILNHINNKKYDIYLILGIKGQQNHYLPFLTNKAVKIEYLNVQLGEYDKAVDVLAKKINQIKPDILFTEAKYTNSIAYHAKKLSKNHDVKLIFREAVNRSACKDEILSQKIKTCIHYNFGPKRIVCISKGVASDLKKHYGIFKNKISVIYNPADLAFIEKRSLEAIDNKEFNTIKGKKIITIGRLSPSKNQKLLLDAFNNLEDRKASLIILGSGELENELKAYCKEKHIHNVHFLGNVPNPYQFLKSSDIFVLSSIREGFGNVIVEAMTVGTPVISTDCPSGPREIIGDNQFGILTPLNNQAALTTAMNQLLNDPSSRKKYSQLGKQRSLAFAVNKIVGKYETVIDEVYNNNKRSKK